MLFSYFGTKHCPDIMCDFRDNCPLVIFDAINDIVEIDLKSIVYVILITFCSSRDKLVNPGSDSSGLVLVLFPKGEDCSKGLSQ